VKKIGLLALVLALVVACRHVAQDSAPARQALEDYFEALNSADYPQADALLRRNVRDADRLESGCRSG